MANTWQQLPAFKRLKQLPQIGKLYFLIWRSSKGELKAGLGEFNKKNRFGIKRIGGSVSVCNVRFCLPIVSIQEGGTKAKFSVKATDKDRVTIACDRDNAFNLDYKFIENGGLLNSMLRPKTDAMLLEHTGAWYSWSAYSLSAEGLTDE